MKNSITLAISLLVLISASNTFARGLNFIENDKAIATKGNESLYLYEGRVSKDSSVACWTMLQTQKSGTGSELIGISNNLFEYFNSTLSQRNLRFSTANSSNGDSILVKVSVDSYSSQLNLNEEGRLSSYILNTRISKIKELWYGLNSETHSEYHDLKCVGLKNVTEIKSINSDVQKYIFEDLEKFRK